MGSFEGDILLACLFPVLGFNLLGEGLRRQLAPRRQRETLLTQIASDVAGVLEDRWFDPLSPWRRNLAYSLATVTLLVLILGGGVMLWQAEADMKKGRRVIVSVMSASRPIPGRLVDVGDDGIVLEVEGPERITVSYKRISAIDIEAAKSEH